MTAPGDNRLAALSAYIRAADGRFRRSAREAATAAIEAGNSLIEAKTLVSHGEWMPWLRINAAMSVRTATRYMRLARSGLDIGHVADLGVRGAEASLVTPRRRAPSQNETLRVSRELTDGGYLVAYLWPSPRYEGFHEFLKQRVEASPWRCSQDVLSKPVRTDMVPVVLESLALNRADDDYDAREYPDDLLKLLEEWRADILSEQRSDAVDRREMCA
jgi:hypothetical protein